MTAQQAERLVSQALQDAITSQFYHVTIALQRTQDESNTPVLCVVWIDGKTTVTSVLRVK